MTTYNTGNPIGSTDARDLYDNAQNLDNFANGSAASYTDRLGVSRRSLSGIDSAADNVLNSIGYAVPVAYTSGISLTLTSQTIDYNGVIYAPLSSALPFTTSSWGTDSAKFRAIQVTDADLITYNPAGTGAVATTVEEALLRPFNVWRFIPLAEREAIAAGTSAYDCTSAIQSAVTEYAGNVDFGSFGVFRVTGPIGLPTNYVTGENSINLVGSGATIKVESAEAVFTSERSRATPDSTSDLYTAKINVKGLNFLGSGAASVVFNGDRLYNLYVQNCNFKSCSKVIYSYRNKGASYPNGYLQSVAFVNCHFAQNTKIVDAKFAFNFLFDGNFCETNVNGVYIDGVGDPAITNLRVVNNLFEGGGVFLKLGAVLGGVFSGNYMEANTVGDTSTLKCHVHMVRASGGYTSGFVFSNNSFAASEAQKTDPDWRDVKFASGLTITDAGVRPPVFIGNWSNSYRMATEFYVSTALGNGGPGGDVLAQQMNIPTPHQDAGISYAKGTREFLASTYLSAGVFTVAEIKTTDIKDLLPLNSTSRAHTAELTLLIQNLTSGNVCVGASVAKILLVIQGAQGGGDVGTMFVAGSLVSFAQIPTGNTFDTRFGSEFKPHFTNPTLTIVPNGTDNYFLKLSGYAAVSVNNYGTADRVRTSIVMQNNASAFGNTLRGLLTLI